MAKHPTKAAIGLKSMPVVLLYRKDETTATVRVGKNTWAGDQFEVLSNEEFAVLQKVCSQLTIPLQPYDDED